MKKRRRRRGNQQGQPYTITKALTHIRLDEANTGKHYGSFHKDLRARHKRDRARRRRKAKLRACLKKKGVKKLPSTSSRTGQRLIRHVKIERSIFGTILKIHW